MKTLGKLEHNIIKLLKVYRQLTIVDVQKLLNVEHYRYIHDATKRLQKKGIIEYTQIGNRRAVALQEENILIA